MYLDPPFLQIKEPVLVYMAFIDPDVIPETASSEEGEIFLVSELFSVEQFLASDSFWDSYLNENRNTLKLKQRRQKLLSKYELKGDRLNLGSPKMNKELMTALSKHQAVTKNRQKDKCKLGLA